METKMSEWIAVDPRSLTTGEHSTKNGVWIEVGLSPYDVPEGVRGYHDDQADEFVIELKYLEEPLEPIKNTWSDENITLLTGENSGRLYRIHINVDKLNAKAVSLKLVREQIDRMASNNERKRLHYQAASEALEKSEPLLHMGP